ncbi:hypothetical protein [Kineosporia corallincola]|nr:hypothetical protein [Kineosporia corallincola]
MIAEREFSSKGDKIVIHGKQVIAKYLEPGYSTPSPIDGPA